MAASDRRLTALALSVALSIATSAARAGDPAAAEALFEQGRELMKAGRFDLACKKLEESQALEPGAGTLFNLAVCYESGGRLASAWATYREVEALTRAAGQPERERVAHDRALVLEPRLAYLTIDVVAPQAPGVVVKRDESVVGPLQWGVAIPVDRGVHTVVATAPGRVPYRSEMEAGEEGQRLVVRVPELASEESVVAAPAEPPPAAAPAAPPLAAPERMVPITIGALGVVAVGVGSYFGLRSISQHADSQPHCDGDVCDQTGFDMRKGAIVSGNVSTVLIGVGAAAIVVAGVFWLVAKPEAPTNGRARRIAPLAW
jgi:hypothetical protein